MIAGTIVVRWTGVRIQNASLPGPAAEAHPTTTNPEARWSALLGELQMTPHHGDDNHAGASPRPKAAEEVTVPPTGPLGS